MTLHSPEQGLASPHESVVSNGPHEGHTLHRLLEEYPDALLGSVPRPTRAGQFPLLLKLIDTAQWLSVQVHPDDAFALAHEGNELGKSEMWVI